VRELAGHFEVLRVAVFAQTLVALLTIFLAQCIRVKAQRRGALGCHVLSSSEMYNAF
jgi:hypothetical protein